MQFSSVGPNFPQELIGALRSSTAVFLCGAGVSYPAKLPDFRRLVNKIYSHVGEVKNLVELDAFRDGRFDECLGSLSSRLTDKRDIGIATAAALVPSKKASLDSHHTLLRLAASGDSTFALVTTNFDTLFERALHYKLGRTKQDIRKLSSAYSSIPAPGGDRFNGIIHLHGRLADDEMELEDTDLVLTSGQFGTAYMRDGWATRFLLDLVRCRTVVMVGYSANDPPVRYILHVLGVEKERFNDARPVYAIEAVKSFSAADTTKQSEKWAALNVEPIFYVKSDLNHTNLWADLKSLAELIEQAGAWVESHFGKIIGKPLAQASAAERQEALTMFLQHPEKASEKLVESLEDGDWLEFFQSKNLIAPKA